jgi:hypothetical protein
MTTRKGFLLVTMEPPPALEEEFNDWYDTEHVPERLAVPGFETATRYVCTSGWPRYMAFYDLASADVIASPAYQAISGENFSPWTKRILARARGFYRAFGEQAHPGNALRGDAGRLQMVRFQAAASTSTETLVAALGRELVNCCHVRQWRVLQAAGVGGDLIALIELSTSSAAVTTALQTIDADHAIAALNEYMPYRPAAG